jgi:hypothetical protein
VVLLYFLARVGTVLFSPTPGALAANLARSLVQLVPVLLIFWGSVTMTFAILEYVHRQHGQGASWNEWDPAKLPPLTHPKKQKSRATRIADLVMHCLWMLYVLAIPHHLYLVLGPGATFLTRLSADFAPVWRLFYIAILVLCWFSSQSSSWLSPVAPTAGRRHSRC